MAQQTIAELDGEGISSTPIVTQVRPAGTFYEAEAYHQEYFVNNPQQGYCALVVAPKLKKFREKFAQKRRKGA
jgi:peptide-methionine (S)-S-oxide reductase